MCDPISQGGVKCATHTRPNFVEALRLIDAGKPFTPTLQRTLIVSATDYAQTRTGLEQVKTCATKYGRARKRAVATILKDAAIEGAKRAEVAKLTAAKIKADAARKEALLWASTAPTHKRALDEYYAIISTDLKFSIPEAVSKYDALHEKAKLGVLPIPSALNQLRFITLMGKKSVGTDTDPATLATITALEQECIEARLLSRGELSEEDSKGRTWVRYENESMSEIVRTVRYDYESEELEIGLLTGDIVSLYSYSDLESTLVEALVSARSIGRFYAHVFSPELNGASMVGKSINNYSFAHYGSNKMVPFNKATGTVPLKYLSSVGFQA
jgi:hypothetical protein